MMSVSRASSWLQSYSVDQNNRVVSSQSQKAVKVAVTSGKGGVGKTSIALLLARTLSFLGHKVLLIDCDTNLSNTAVKLGLPLSDNFYSLITMKKSFDDCLIKDVNFHLLAGCNGNIDLFTGDFRFDQIIPDIIAKNESKYDYIILDSPAGIDRTTLTLNAICDKRIAVVNPDTSSITDSYSLMKVLHLKYGVNENYLFVNRANNVQSAKICKKMGDAIDKFWGGSLKLFGFQKVLNLGQNEFDRVVKIADEDIFKEFYKSTRKFAEETLVGRCYKSYSLNVAKDSGKEQDVHY